MDKDKNNDDDEDKDHNNDNDLDNDNGPPHQGPSWPMKELGQKPCYRVTALPHSQKSVDVDFNFAQPQLSNKYSVRRSHET